jgi:spore coat protein U-like protein
MSNTNRAKRRATKTLPIGIAILLLLTGGASAAADLTELSLQELMNVEVSSALPSARFQVSATAVDSCVVATGDHAFGNYDPLAAAPTDAMSTVTVTCTPDVLYNIGLDSGTGFGATTTNRKMTKGAESLNYSLYRDAARLLVWGNTVGSDTIAGFGTGIAVAHPVYSRIPAKQAVRRGAYVDTITVTLTY